ncbi:hypothetical protein H4W79_001109 [Nocardiopsis terrae]|uniref:Uncharacterized protein n=1 Tax=Nocardiopsis terrae TaxID=372655 RepID=A0ABR9HD00_9ACTN|nr:hypothetical protein [Nocardiopsis terrae]MBE1456895.1 hypothetical protein [Nocardiopsis terrae]
MLRNPAIPLLSELRMISTSEAVLRVYQETSTRPLELLHIP